MKILTIRWTWFRFLFILILILGINFRFINLDKKVYWHDEVHTSIRMSGYADNDILEVFSGEVLTPNEVLRLQSPTPEKDWQDVFQVLSRSPEHPPLYYILARYWVLLFGASVSSIRALSAIISLLVFPGLYWLCWELFRSNKIGLMAIILVSVSPFHVLYAQEAREYSLWTVLVLLSSAALLRAINIQKTDSNFVNTLPAWSLYTITLTLGLYTSLLSGAVGISYGIYMILLERFRLTKCFLNFIIASFVAALLYIPWVMQIVNNYAEMQHQTSWMSGTKPIIELIGRWELNFSSIFIDIHPSINYWIIPRISILFFFAIGYAVYRLYRHSSKQARLFIITLITIPALALIIPDIIPGGQRSVNARYYVPSYIGIQISVAYLLCHANWINRKIRPFILPLILSFGIISCLISAQSETWWTKSASYNNAEAATIINQFDSPLLISDTNQINVGNLISLTHKLDSKVRLQFVLKSNIPQIPDGFNPILLYNPSNTLTSGIEQQYNWVINPVENSNAPLYQVKQPLN
ncbi:MAG: glycosyltransferase family 39 protein [Microcoleaceae cyanobacterium]